MRNFWKNSNMRLNEGEATCLPDSNDSVRNENEQDDKWLNERCDLVFGLLEPRKHLQSSHSSIYTSFTQAYDTRLKRIITVVLS